MLARDRAGPTNYPTSWRAWLLTRPPFRRLLPLLGDRRHALRADAKGLHELLADGGEVCHPWDTVRPPTLGRRGWVLHAGEVSFRVWGSVPGSWRLMQEISGRCESGADDSAAIPPEQIEAWLGVGPEEWLVVREPPRAARAVPALMAAMFGLLILVGLFGGTWAPAIGMATGSLVPLLFFRGDRRTVAASRFGLRLDRRTIPWSEVVGAPSGMHGYVAQTHQGAIGLGVSMKGVKVATTIHTLLALRQTGAVLPRMTAIPDHALSRAESVEVNAERGISPAEGDG